MACIRGTTTLRFGMGLRLFAFAIGFTIPLVSILSWQSAHGQNAKAEVRLENPADKRKSLRLIIDKGDDLFYAGKFEDAIREYKEALMIPMADKDVIYEAYIQIGMAFKSLQKYDAAIDAYKHAIQVMPTLREAYADLGFTYLQMKQDEKAAEAFKQTLDHSPTSEDYNNLGTTYVFLKRYPEAIELFKQALQAKPDNVLAQRNLATVYYFMEKYEEALEALKKALSLDAKDADTYTALGAAYFGLKRYEESIKASEQAIVLDPTSANPHYHLGRAYLAMGKKDEVMAQHKILQTMDQNLAKKLLGEIAK